MSINKPKPAKPNGGLPTYDGFVKEYGERPADIAFNMAVRLTASILKAQEQERVERICKFLILSKANLLDVQKIADGSFEQSLKEEVM